MPSHEQLTHYADILLQIGINLQPNQPLQVNAPIELAPFVRVLTERAYLAGAHSIDIELYDPLCRRIALEKMPDASLTFAPDWPNAKMRELIALNAGFIGFHSADPDLLAGIEPTRIATRSGAQGKAYHTVSEDMINTCSWLGCSVPTSAWAQKVFPNHSPEAAISALWEAIFHTMRMDQPNPVAAWRRHLENLHARATYLNDARFDQLHYSAPGTDLWVGLPKGHIWTAGDSKNAQGVSFTPNMPTEEVFTMPKRDRVNGTVRSSMPLSTRGVLIEEIELHFEKGRITDYSASKGYNTLKGLIESDEGAHYLGEIALVPYNSPISQMNTLFYNTLFDENASCHFAIGNAYANTIEGGLAMSTEELLQAGANVSTVHVDFMIGTKEMQIDGVQEDGTVQALFRNGSWA